MKRPGTRKPHSSETGEDSAFTLAELLVVLGALALLTFTLLPTLALTKGDSRAFQCLNNTRELNRAWRMWSDDNQDLLPYANEVFSCAGPSSRLWVLPQQQPDTCPTNPPYWDPRSTIWKSPLWPYCGTILNLWQCPADQSGEWLNNGFFRRRVRSYTMNSYLGGYGGTDPGWNVGTQYRIYLKVSDIVNPWPAGVFVFTEFRFGLLADNEYVTVMDGYSPKNPGLYKFLAYPDAYHDGAANFSYADGRAEMHRWLDRRTTTPPGFQMDLVASPSNPDIGWLQDRATRPK